MNSTQVKRREETTPSGGPGLSRMPLPLISYLPPANVENCWRFPEGLSYPARATCTLTATSSASSSRNKFLTVKHLFPYRHMLHCTGTFFRRGFSRRKQKRKTNRVTMEDRKYSVDPVALRENID